jgi:hypothetical protein
MVSPVMKLASSLARNSAAAAISSGLANRPSGRTTARGTNVGGDRGARLGLLIDHQHVGARRREAPADGGSDALCPACNDGCLVA